MPSASKRPDTRLVRLDDSWLTLVAGRRDVIDAWRRDLTQEAPWAYKDVGPVVESLRAAEVAAPVVELRPILTVKG